VTDSALPASCLAAFRGTVSCRRSWNALTLTGAAAAAEPGGGILIVTLTTFTVPDVPESLAAASISALDGQRYRIASGSGEWIVTAATVHVHRDIGDAFYGAIPPRAVPLRKRLFWRIVLALAGTGAGKRLLLFLRRRVQPGA
jgi:hypothetical protein